jgi:hypothetical protein
MRRMTGFGGNRGKARLKMAETDAGRVLTGNRPGKEGQIVQD